MEVNTKQQRGRDKNRIYDYLQQPLFVDAVPVVPSLCPPAGTPPAPPSTINRSFTSVAIEMNDFSTFMSCFADVSKNGIPYSFPNASPT